MSAEMLDCAAVSASIREKCAAEAREFRGKGIVPTLAILRVGEKAPDISYERGAARTMEEVGVAVRLVTLPADTGQETYERTLTDLSNDPAVHGILALRPLDQIDDDAAIARCLAPEKDVDCSTPANMGKVLIGDPTALYPCTAQAVLEVADYYAEELRKIASERYAPLPYIQKGMEGEPCYGLDVCIINRSNVIGKPLAVMLLNRGASVTVVHRRTHEEKLSGYTGGADLLVAATPAKDSVTADMVKQGAFVIDASTIYEKVFDESGEPVINEKTGRQRIRVRGCCAEDVKEKALYMTPVPGMGAITSAVLAKNVLRACRLAVLP